MTVEVEAGKFIHEAAILAGLRELELPCGGLGTCGLCLVETRGVLVPACQTKVMRDLDVTIPEQTSATAMRVVGDSHFLLSEDSCRTVRACRRSIAWSDSRCPRLQSRSTIATGRGWSARSAADRWKRGCRC